MNVIIYLNIFFILLNTFAFSRNCPCSDDSRNDHFRKLNKHQHENDRYESSQVYHPSDKTKQNIIQDMSNDQVSYALNNLSPKELDILREFIASKEEGPKYARSAHHNDFASISKYEPRIDDSNRNQAVHDQNQLDTEYDELAEYDDYKEPESGRKFSKNNKLAAMHTSKGFWDTNRFLRKKRETEKNSISEPKQNTENSNKNKLIQDQYIKMLDESFPSPSASFVSSNDALVRVKRGETSN